VILDATTGEFLRGFIPIVTRSTPQDRRWRSIAVATAFALASQVAGCGLTSPPEHHDLNVENGTTLAVSIVVNGGQIVTVPPGESQVIPEDQLPVLPWSVDARSPSGRLLLHFDAPVGSISSTTNHSGGAESHGVGTLVDLTCGRLAVYAGSPIPGPMPLPGTLNDCSP
jgi:hypothetical protein